MSKLFEIIGYVIVFGLVGISFADFAKPKEVAGYLDPIMYYSDAVFMQTGEKKCKLVKAGDRQGKLVKVGCNVFTDIQLAKMQWKPAK